MELRQGWSESSFRVAIGALGTLVGLWVVTRSVSSGNTIETVVGVLWLVLVGTLTFVEAIRAQTKRLWAVLDPNGVTDYNGRFYAWEELDEVRYIFGDLCFGTSDGLIPKVALRARVLGDEQLELAEQFVRSNAPERLLSAL